MNYELDITIDGEALDQEWLRHPVLMLKYAQHSAKMQHKLEAAKQALDIAKSEADKMIRTDPESYEILKVTEASVANAIINEDGYKSAYEDYLSTKYEADMARAAVNAFEHRKSALENLVKLYGQQYFAGPSAPYQINREWEVKEKDKLRSVKIAEGMQRRKTNRED